MIQIEFLSTATGFYTFTLIMDNPRWYSHSVLILKLIFHIHIQFGPDYCKVHIRFSTPMASFFCISCTLCLFDEFYLFYVREKCLKLNRHLWGHLASLKCMRRHKKRLNLESTKSFFTLIFEHLDRHMMPCKIYGAYGMAHPVWAIR